MAKQKKKKVEWSKLITGSVIISFGVYGIWCGFEYYRLSKLAIECNATPPDAVLAVTCVTTVLASLLSYCLYQFGLKNSRNKYGIGENGQPYNTEISFEENESNNDNV